MSVRIMLLDPRAAIGAGLVGGMAFGVIEIGIEALAGDSGWGQLRMIAGIVFGRDAVPPPWTFDLWPVLTGIMVHLGLSLLYAMIGGLAFHRLALMPSLLLGVVLGFLLYIINFYGFVGWFDWFAQGRTLLTVLAHVLFGIVVAGTYHGIRSWDARQGREVPDPGFRSHASQTHRKLGPFHLDVNWNAAVYAALISGMVFIILEMGLVWLMPDQDPWRPMHHIAGIALGPQSVPAPDEPAAFSWRVLTAALLVHFTLSLIYSAVGGVLLSPLRRPQAIIAGAGCGLMLYVINFYGFAALFEWFEEARGWVPITVHLVYGTVSAWGHRAAHDWLE